MDSTFFHTIIIIIIINIVVVIIIHEYLYRIGTSVWILLSIYVLLPNKKR